MILSGKQLLAALDPRTPIDAAFWLLAPDTSTWRLVLATPKIHIDGPRSVFRKVLSVLKRLRPGSLSMNNISVVDTSDPLIHLFRTAIKMGRDVGDTRFTRNTINGVFIPDAYIYRLT